MPIPGRVAARAAALLPFAAMSAACASTATLTEEELLAQGRVVNEARTGAAALAVVERATASEGDAAGDAAEALLASGDAAGALAAVRAALLRLPPADRADRLRAIRVRAKREFLRASVAAAGAEAPERATEGETLRVRVSLRNLSPAPLVVEEPDAGTSPTLVRLRVTRSAFDVFGDVRIETWEESAPLPPGRADSGTALSVEIPVDTARFRTQVPHGFVVYDFGGSLLPSALRAGEVEIHERFTLAEARTMTFPQKGWEEVAGDPAAHLERGLREGNPVRVLVAAACLPEGERARAGAGLSRRLREERGWAPGLALAARAALRFLGGDPEADLWDSDRWEERAAAARAGGKEGGP